MPMDEALRRLQGTLIGSHENALAFGVVINENRGRRFCQAARSLGIPARTWELFLPNDPNDNPVTPG